MQGRNATEIGEIKRHLKALGMKVSGSRKECEQRLKSRAAGEEE